VGLLNHLSSVRDAVADRKAAADLGERCDINVSLPCADFSSFAFCDNESSSVLRFFSLVITLWCDEARRGSDWNRLRDMSQDAFGFTAGQRGWLRRPGFRAGCLV